MQDTGWIKLHRKLRDNEMLRHDHTAYFVFTNLLLMVNSDTGSFSTGRFVLAESLGLNPNTLYSCLKKLEKAKMATLSSNNRFTVISICNWEEYQGKGNNAVNNPSTTDQQLINNKSTLYKNKEIRNKNKELRQSTKVLSADAHGNSDINEIFQFWEKTVGYKIETKLQANRFAANNLLKKHGREKLEGLIRGVVLTHADKYAPRISDFSSLQAKLSELMLWGKQKQQPDKTKMKVAYL